MTLYLPWADLVYFTMPLISPDLAIFMQSLLLIKAWVRLTRYPWITLGWKPTRNLTGDDTKRIAPTNQMQQIR